MNHTLNHQSLLDIKQLFKLVVLQLGPTFAHLDYYYAHQRLRVLTPNTEANKVRKDNLSWSVGQEDAMSEELNKLLEMARRVEMTPEQQEEQRRSFAYGNTKIENDSITWDRINRAAETLKNK